MRLTRPALAAAGVCAGFCAAVVTAAAPAALADLAAGAGPDLQAGSARLAAAVIGGAGSTSAAPDPARPGQIVEFSINCGSPGGATLSGTSLHLAASIPMRSSGGAVTGLFFADVTLPAALHAGTYHPEMACSNGVAGTASLRVTTTPGGGGAATGDGTTSTATDHGLQLTGLSILGIGVIAGAFALRRRRNG